jgi:hypothetical protein
MTAEADVPPSFDGRQPTRLASSPPCTCRAARTAAARRGWRATGLAVALTALAAPVLTACGSASGHPDADRATISAACTAVSGALSDGPDPDADPVGYAEAQIKPLGAIQTSDHALQVAIRSLAAAYAQVLTSDGTSAAASRAVTAAAGQVNAICPGAAS